MNTRVQLLLATALAIAATQDAAAARIRGLPSPPSRASNSPSDAQSTAAQAQPAAAGPATLPSGVEVDPNTVILRFKTVAAAADVESSETVRRRPGAKKLGLDMGVVRKRDNESIDEAVARLNALSPDVEVEPNYIWRPLAVPNDALYASQQAAAMDKIAAPTAWDASTGSAASNAGLVCVIDTGIDFNHPDLVASYAGGYNAIVNTSTPMDDVGHGTHCAGTIGASGNNGQGIAGVNWAARILGCKFMGPNGGNTDDAIECVSWCISQGAKVLSNSWGGGGFSQALLDAINAANNAGAIFVAAAGNSGTNNDISPVYPASYSAPNMITVAASTLTDGRASYSNYGATSVHIAAPGDNIISTFPNSSYVLMGGTSMAAPFVSGAAALLFSATGGKLSGSQVRTLLLNNADKAASIPIQGNRRLNVAKALSAAITAANGGTVVNTTPTPTPATRNPPPPGNTATQPATNPNPAAFPPPPPSASFPITPIARGQTLTGLNLANGGTFQLPSAFLTAATCTSVRSRLTGATAASYKKDVYEVSPGTSTAAFTTSMCRSASTSGWDSVSTLLTCNTALTSCSACAVDTNSCGLMGALTQRTVSASARYLLVVTSSTARAGGAYSLTV